jgi:hypothetical protein
MKWKTLFVVRVYFPDVRDTRIIGQLRNLANEFGRPGIIAKRRQTNHRVQRKSYLRLVWPTRWMARAYQTAVAKLWGGRGITTKRFRTLRPC